MIGTTRVVGGRALLLSALLLVWGAGALAAQATPPEWQPHGRVKEYGRSMIGLPAIVDVAVGSGLNQWADVPSEWDQDWGGFGNRVLSNLGRNSVEETVRHGLAAFMDRSVTYQKCACGKVGGRIVHAFKEAVTDRDREGHRWLSIPRVAGVYTGAFVESLWRPDSSGNEIFWTGTRGLAFAAVGNVWREFIGWPL